MATNASAARDVDFTPLNAVQRNEKSLEACIWFDIGAVVGCSKTRGIAPLMSQRIHDYFVALGFSEEEAWKTHQEYYKGFGLAIRGLQAHHPNFDAVDFDNKCDGSLPLEDLLSEDKPLQQLLADFDRSRVKVMALTNANKPHALRVLRILGVTDLFEGVVSCQYRTTQFPAKPDSSYYQEAMQICGVSDPSKHYFVDDSLLNVRGAKKEGWNSFLFDEDGSYQGKYQEGEIDGVVSRLQDLRQEWKQHFKQS